MGPPPFGGGKLVLMRGYTRPSALQWGRRLSAVESSCSCEGIPDRLRFNGAAAFRRWKGAHGDGTRWQLVDASMGPPPFGGGKIEFRDSWAWEIQASMGPPPFGGGKSPAGDSPRQLSAASMGPPPFGGGKNSSRVSVPSNSSLQWGRRLSAVERAEQGLKGEVQSIASMGPPPFGGGKARGRLRWCRGMASFNGAAAFRRWKVDKIRQTVRAYDHASMGPPPFGGGKAADAASVQTARPASMGPPPFGGGKSWRVRFRN